jgi:myo-inositol-1(or 4)-monophosphatase
MQVSAVTDPGRALIGTGAPFRDLPQIDEYLRTLQGALIGTGFPYRENLHYLDPYMAMLKTVMQTAAGVRRPGAASLDLAYVAAGRTDAFFEIGLKAWDTAAGTLLIREAGGLVGTLDGGEYRQKGNIVAGNPRVYIALIEALAPHLPADLREAAQEQAAKEARAAAMAAVQAAQAAGADEA